MTPITLLLGGLRNCAAEAVPTPAAVFIAKPKLFQPRWKRDSTPRAGMESCGLISLASCGGGGPPFICKGFCIRRVYRPRRITLYLTLCSSHDLLDRTRRSVGDTRT